MRNPRANHHKVQWPEDAIPVEIFSLIISFLPRSSVQSMRLVCKEFESKVAHDLFQTVVVPFSTEIYGIAGPPDVEALGSKHDARSLVQSNAPMMLQDMGMRIFKGFGRHIHRFGMSFELDYSLLANPPPKRDQEAVMSFWGLYRWPFKGYNRYSQLEGLEQTADETRTMAQALRFIGNAKALGLSIDGGLGWLQGSDGNLVDRLNHDVAAVFGQSRFCPEDKASPPCQKPYSSTSGSRLSRSRGGNAPSFASSSSSSRAPVTSSDISVDRLSIFAALLQEVGNDGADLPMSVRTLLETGGSSSLSSSVIRMTRVSSTTIGRNTIFTHRIGDMRDEGDRLESLKAALAAIFRDGSDRDTSEGAEAHRIKPNDLSNAQREMLLETEWAQRAFMQSWAIAIIDNAGTFQNIEKLHIARLPSRHLAILRRDDFWTSLSQLRDFSLAVIPDWREVVKLPTSWVEDTPILPSQAVHHVYNLLKDYIAPKESIKSFHFEWLCGGEEAAGLFARNQFILAAPLVPHATDMVYRTTSPEVVLKFPHMEDLTIKNCWASPHILTRFLSTMKSQALASLTLTSVSLCAPSSRQPQHQQPAAGHGQHPTLLALANLTVQGSLNGTQLPPHGGLPQQLVPQGAMTLFGGPPQLAPSLAPPRSWSEQPRNGTWAFVIDQVTPGKTLAHFRHERDEGPPPPTGKPSHLKSIAFDSCGYVRLGTDTDQSMLHPLNDLPGDSHAIAKRRSDLEQYMMKSRDRMLATIVNHIHEDEARTLQNAWGLQLGWQSDKAAMFALSIVDGVRRPGTGRFRGTVAHVDMPT
jgi:hypothetical protein